MKKNICITGLLTKYSENITEQFAKEMESFYANVLKLVQFDIVDISNTIELCGVLYYKELVGKKLKELSKFNDVVIFCNYYFVQAKELRKIFEKNLITIYLDVGEEDYNKLIKYEKLTELETKIEKGAYKIRNKYFAKNCDIVVKCDGLTEIEVIRNIKDRIIEYISKGVKKK